MPLTLQQEAFASGLVAGMNRSDAYIAAGYTVKNQGVAAVIGGRLAKNPEVIALVERLRAEKAEHQAEAKKLAIERTAITMERVAIELGRIGFANMDNFVRISEVTGDPHFDFSGVTREMMAAVTEITIDDYLDGRNKDAREVRKVKLKLGDKRAALMDIAKLFGWIVEKRENKIVDEFADMSDEQIEAWLDERAEARVKMRQRALSGRHRMHRGWPPAGGIGSRGRMA
jgi:phage terminase small subunit